MVVRRHVIGRLFNAQWMVFASFFSLTLLFLFFLVVEVLGAEVVSVDPQAPIAVQEGIEISLSSPMRGRSRIVERVSLVGGEWQLGRDSADLWGWILSCSFFPAEPQMTLALPARLTGAEQTEKSSQTSCSTLNFLEKPRKQKTMAKQRGIQSNVLLQGGREIKMTRYPCQLESWFGYP